VYVVGVMMDSDDEDEDGYGYGASDEEEDGYGYGGRDEELGGMLELETPVPYGLGQYPCGWS